MPGDARVLELVQRIVEFGATPEEACADHPDLLHEVRKRLKRARIFEARLYELFPPSSEESKDVSTRSSPAFELPDIPGYELEETIGQGGMGIVFRARHLKLNRLIALKMLLAGAFASPQQRARFVREAEAVAALSHPHIVQIHDVGEFERSTYFTMEFLEGGSLAQQLAGMPQPAPKSALLVETLAQAIGYAHDRGVVHRDLKPSNILLNAYGEPKIADFGLAHVENAQSDLTLSGARLGTPSYMAPEQASGDLIAIGAATDIYALGAILYEMLTGRPPFRADTAAETIRQVIFEEPARPSRLNASVPRDLEIICLKCLQKEPLRRYATANQMADDLRRFLAGQPILARPVGRLEKALKWGKRCPAEAGLVALILIVTGIALGGGFWLERERSWQREASARREGKACQALIDAMKNGKALQNHGAWPASLSMLREAERFLTESNNPELEQSFRQACEDAEIVTELEDIRLRGVESRYDRAMVSPSADTQYSNAFRRYGIPVLDISVDEAEQVLSKSGIREPLITFLHDWLHDASITHHPRLELLLDRVDTNTWRTSVRHALISNDADQLRTLIRAPHAALQPAIVFAGLASGLREKASGEELLSLLREVQRRHSEDFWTHYIVGDSLLQRSSRDAVGPLSAAVGIRPKSPYAYLLLGRALREIDDASGAITAFRMAIALDPTNAGVKEMATVLTTHADLEEIRLVWEKALETNPPAHDRWFGYAELCLFLKNEEAYAKAREALLKRPIIKEDFWTVAERTCLTCLLRPAGTDELNPILAAVDRAVAVGPKFPHPDNAYIQFVEGLTQYRLGRFQQAIPLLEEASAILPNRPGPRLVLAMSYFRVGESAKAKKILSTAILRYNWQQSQAKGVTAWVSHVLRREAEATIFPDINAVLALRRSPRDNDERFAALGACQFEGRFGLATELYDQLFESIPDFADQMSIECRLRAVGLQGSDRPYEILNSEYRYIAARCAALAANGSGIDGASLTDSQRRRYRERSRAWLLAELAEWEAILHNGSAMDRDLTKKMLTYWEVDPDLASLREPSSLKNMATEERLACQELWREVDSLQERASQGIAASTIQQESRSALVEQRRLEEARLRWEMDLETSPDEPDAWNCYAELCLFLGHEEEFRRGRRALLMKFGQSPEGGLAERIGKTSLLAPVDGEVLAGIASIVGRATATQSSEEWVRPFYSYTEGLCAFRQGNFEDAISCMRERASNVYGPAPGLIVAMALEKSGRHLEAVEALSSAIQEFDWRRRFTRDPATWTFNVLRREAEAMILPNLEVFFDGKWRPLDNSERLALLGACQFDERWEVAAELYADAFASDPNLGEELITVGLKRFPWGQATMDPLDVLCSHSRYGAARCAALAASSSVDQDDVASKAEQTKWHMQSLQWLEADLIAWKLKLAKGAAAERDIAKQMLLRWQSEPDLDSVRDLDALMKMPPELAARYRKLWKMVDDTLADTSPLPQASTSKPVNR